MYKGYKYSYNDSKVNLSYLRLEVVFITLYFSSTHDQ